MAILSDAGEIATVAPGWDSLAVAAAAPRSAPVPVLGWLRRAAPAGARPRVLVATDRAGSVAGVLPLVVTRDRFGFVHYDLPGAGVLFGVEPLARAGDQPAVMAAMCARVAALHPVPDTIAVGSMQPRWEGAAASALADRFEQVRGGRYPVCVADLGGGFERWLERRRAGHRAELRNKARRFAREGFTTAERCDAGEVVERLPLLREMYLRRQQVRRGPAYRFDDRMQACIEAMAESWSGTGRLRLTSIERPGEVAGSGLVLAAGGTASSWITCFDPRWHRSSPAIQTIVEEMRLAAARGEDRFDLGAGDEVYKADLADRREELAWGRWQRRGLLPLHTPAALVPRRARTRARELATRVAGGRDQPEKPAAKAAVALGAEGDGKGSEP